MNTKLALSALVAALMLTACAKQESAAPEAAPPATEAPAAPEATPPADTAPPATDAAPTDGGTAAPPAEEAPKQ
jgi:PBP1b-binding outer membrane lipoprotein LpoB